MLHDLTKRIAERWRIYRDIKKLAQFDDHLLADIGVERDQITRRVSSGR
jgi:uncharacterized protein YjiS (DUF1127 family)